MTQTPLDKFITKQKFDDCDELAARKTAEWLARQLMKRMTRVDCPQCPSELMVILPEEIEKLLGDV